MAPAGSGTLAGGLEAGQNAFGAGLFEGAGFVDLDRLDRAVVDDHGETLAAQAQAARAQVQLKAGGLGEFGGTVTDQQNLAFGALVLGPGAHDEGIVDRHADDLVDALALQVGGFFDEAREMLGRAGRRERARNAEHHDGLAFEQVVRAYGGRAVAGHLIQSCGRNFVSNTNRHRNSPGFGFPE